jgi:hypothetical protein
MSLGIEAKMHLLAVVAILVPVTLLAAAHLLPVTPAGARASLFRLPRGPMLRLGVLALCALLAEGAIGDWAAVYLRDDLTAGAATAALGFAAFSLAMATGRFCGDALVESYGGASVLTGGAGVAALVLAGALLLGRPGAALVGFTAVGLGLANAVPIVFGAAGKVRGTSPELGASRGVDRWLLRLSLGTAADRVCCRASGSGHRARLGRSGPWDRGFGRGASGIWEKRGWTVVLIGSHHRDRPAPGPDRIGRASSSSAPGSAGFPPRRAWLA